MAKTDSTYRGTNKIVFEEDAVHYTGVEFKEGDTLAAEEHWIPGPPPFEKLGQTVYKWIADCGTEIEWMGFPVSVPFNEVDWDIH